MAIKVLPAGLSADRERLNRFEQEARAAAALNHPNILAVYDIGQHDGSPYIVSELLEGETLRERLNGGALPVRKAVEYAVQIAHGLAAAHEKGITHRDLKPENIFVTTDGRVKILDFGLAKLTQTEPALAGLSELPTPPPNTLPGVVLGTIGYMAPEQVRGLTADHRSDIFAFGAILYETLSGQRAFRGETAADTMTAILKEDPAELPIAERNIPNALSRIVQRCLEKSPIARFKSADDLAFALDALGVLSGSTPAVESHAGPRPLAWTLVGVLGLALVAMLAAGSVLYVRRVPPDLRLYRSSILPPAGMGLPAAIVPAARFALSPDGRRLAFVGAENPQASLQEILAGGVTQLWVQSLDGLVAQPLAGTEGAVVPFWSPDSRFLGFKAGNKLKVIDAAGGPPLTLADTGGTTGATWNRDGVILFSTTGPGNPVRRVLASGGAPSPVTTIDTDNGETQHWYPFFLPDGRHFLYLAVGSKTGGPVSPNGIYVTALDSNERKLLVPGGSPPMYAEGYLFFLREQTLMAQPFDVERLDFTGDALPIVEQVAVGGASGVVGGFTVSAAGVLAYQTGAVDAGGNQGPLTQLTWLDRSGKQIGILGDPARSIGVQLAPDDTRAAVSVFDTARRVRDIWLFDIVRGLRTRFTFDPADETAVVWSPDGSRIVFNSTRKGQFDLYLKEASGAGVEQEVLVDGLGKTPADWSADGRFVLFNVGAPTTGSDLWVLPLFGDRKALLFLQTPFNEGAGRFSPDGRWIAYVSSESGRSEVYVAPFPGTGGKWQVSTTGGNWPRWRRDGREIFYLASDNKLIAAAVDGQGSAFAVGAVRPLFDVRPSRVGSAYDVSSDGQRFLVNALVEEAALAPITLVVNWPALLKK